MIVAAVVIVMSRSMNGMGRRQLQLRSIPEIQCFSAVQAYPPVNSAMLIGSGSHVFPATTGMGTVCRITAGNIFFAFTSYFEMHLNEYPPKEKPAGSSAGF
jgi:hypothetical protein